MSDPHEVGELLTKEIVGKTLYSHVAACKGKMVKLFITEVGYTHTSYETEDGKVGSFVTGSQGKGARNWEAISFELAKKEALRYHAQEMRVVERNLLALRKATISIGAMKSADSELVEKDECWKKSLEYRYCVSQAGEVRVATNPNNYCKNIHYALELFQVLIGKIPFSYEISSEPEFVILGGDFRKRIMSVEVCVRHNLEEKDVIAKLKQAGFREGMEAIL